MGCSQIKQFPIYLHEYSKAHLILSEIENALSGGKEEINFGRLQVEHTMPQTLEGSTWIDYLKRLNCPSSSQKPYCDTLGNLTLTSQNPQLARKPFSEKKSILEDQSRLEINRHFSNLNDWTYTEIQARSEVLADKFLEIWPRYKSLCPAPEIENQSISQLSVFDRI